MFLLDAVYKSTNDRLTLEEYNSLCLLYIPQLAAQDSGNLLPPEFALVFSTDPKENVVLINRDNLKKLGVTIHDKKTEIYDLKQEDITRLLASYNEVRSICISKKNGGNFGVSPVGFDQRQVKHYYSIIKFFEHSKIDDWFLFFYAVHMANKWSWVYSLAQCCTSRMFNVYFNNKDRAFSEIEETKQRIKEQDAEKLAEQDGAKLSLWFSYYPHLEDIKNDLIFKQNKPEVCFNRVSDLLGYNPKSKACNSCSLNGTCADALRRFFQETSKSSVDILQLRGYYSTPDFKMILEQARKTLTNEGSTFSFY